MALELLLLLIGFVLLIKGADFLVEGASGLAKRVGVSDLVIGLTIVSFGTSAPEVIVSLLSAIRGNTDLALGNIIGSNIANILLILGIAATIYSLRIKSTTVSKEIPLVLVASVSLFLLANDSLFEGTLGSAVTRVDGLMLLMLFAIFMYYIWGLSRRGDKVHPENVHRLSPARAAVYILGGIVGLALGGNWIVNGATTIAQALGVSQALIGLTIIAIGTSLPELATSAVAAWKKNADIAVGNVVGSNLFNILFVLAITSIVRPLPFAPSLNFDIIIMIGAAALLLTAAFTGKKKRAIERWEGILFLLLYAGYLVYLVLRG